MMASTGSLDLCFIFTSIHHDIWAVRKHGFILNCWSWCLDPSRVFFFCLLFGAVMAWDWSWSPCPFVERRGGTGFDVSSEGLLLCQHWGPGTDTMEAERLRLTGEGSGEVGVDGKGGSLQKRDRQKRREGKGGRAASAARARGESRVLCAADCLIGTEAAGWWHFMVTTCNPTKSSW